MRNIEKVMNVIKTANLYTQMGKIDKIVGMTVESIGPVCNIGDVCTIEIPNRTAPAYAEVVGFRENKVLLMPYDEIQGIGYGSAVSNTGDKLRIPVTNDLIGRTVDALGQPIDGKGPIRGERFYSITGKESNPMLRPRIDTTIQMG